MTSTPDVRRRVCAGLVVAVALTVATTTPARAARRVVFPGKDNTLIEDATGRLSNGVGSGLFVGKTHAASLRRALLQFNVAAIIPAGAHVDSVWLQMTLTRTSDPAPTLLALHRVVADWGEGLSNSGGGMLGGGGGAPAVAGDATWLHRFFDTQTWANPGGDYEAVASGSTWVAGASAIGQRFTWGSQPAMVNDVQAWLDASATNFGWILVGDETVTMGAPSTRRFASREAVVEADRPQLIVEYSGVGVEMRTWAVVKRLYH